MIFFLEDENCIIIECQCRSASEVNLVERMCVCGWVGGTGAFERSGSLGR